MDKFTKFADVLIESTQDEKFQDFLESRKEGAAKIQATSAAKGGVATLTAQHFAAKAKPYAKAIECVNSRNREETFEKHADDCLKKLKQWRKMTQREFQAIMGELEVWGEVYLRSKGS
jgi:hypothetical protein